MLDPTHTPSLTDVTLSFLFKNKNIVTLGVYCQKFQKIKKEQQEEMLFEDDDEMSIVDEMSIEESSSLKDDEESDSSDVSDADDEFHPVRNR